MRNLRLSLGWAPTSATLYDWPHCAGQLRPNFVSAAVRLFRDRRGEYASENAAYRAIAPKLGGLPDRRRVWRQQAKRDAGQRGRLTSAETDWINELEREVCILLAHVYS